MMNDEIDDIACRHYHQCQSHFHANTLLCDHVFFHAIFRSRGETKGSYSFDEDGKGCQVIIFASTTAGVGCLVGWLAIYTISEPGCQVLTELTPDVVWANVAIHETRRKHPRSLIGVQMSVGRRKEKMRRNRRKHSSFPDLCWRIRDAFSLTSTVMKNCGQQESPGEQQENERNQTT